MTDKQAIPEIHSRNIACVVSCNSQSFTNHQPLNISNHCNAKYEKYSNKKKGTDWRKISLEQTVSFPVRGQNSSITTFGQSQCFHLRTPSHTANPRKQPLQQSFSLPDFTTNGVTDIHEQIPRNVNFSNRPLPLVPGVLKRDKPTMQNSLKRKQQSYCQQRKYSEGGQRMWKKELLRRKTVHNFPSRKIHSDQMSRIISFGDSVEDHIYEEIDEEDHDIHDSMKENEQYSFLTLISSERR